MGFNVGDVVQLKSGGPEMTIESVRKNSVSGKMEVECSWFLGNEIKGSRFPQEALKKVQDE